MSAKRDFVAQSGIEKTKGDKIIMAAKVDTDKCTGCGLCVKACPVEAIRLESEKAKVDEDTCVDCGVCASECPNEAIRVD